MSPVKNRSLPTAFVPTAQPAATGTAPIGSMVEFSSRPLRYRCQAVPS